MARHRHQEFIRFLNRIEAAVPAGKLVHAILDNYAAHKHPKVRSGSAASAVDLSFHPDLVLLGQCGRRLFCTLTRRRLQRGVFHSLVDLQAAINRYLGEHNVNQTVRLDRRPRPNYRKGQSRAPSDRVHH